MAKTESKMIELGTLAPDFILKDVLTGKETRMHEAKSCSATVIMFICNHCPYVKHINHGLVELATQYITQGIRFIAINSNDIENYPDDSPENMISTAQANHFPFPYLYDETQEVARAFQATCTPDFFVFNGQNRLVYRGQFDPSRPGNTIPVTGECIREALDCILTGTPVTQTQRPSLGCNIKWKTQGSVSF